MAFCVRLRESGIKGFLGSDPRKAGERRAVLMNGAEGINGWKRMVVYR